MKRLMDLVGSGVGLLLLWPFFLLAAIAIKLDDRGPVFFRQERVGRYGRMFRIWKFRTMVMNAEKLGAQVTVGRDPRITAVGHTLRRFKLDEFPQLINVFTGEMSLVGPRPEVPQYVAYYSPEQRAVLDLRPGITDPASIQFRDESALLADKADPVKAYIEELMPEKIRINLDYAARANAFSDFGMVLKTLGVLGR